MAPDEIIYACDVGSTLRENFAWSRWPEEPKPKSCDEAFDIDKLVERVRRDLQEGNRVALGLESPLVLPVAIENSDLSKGRLARDKKPDGQPRELDGNRSCFAPSGGYVATLGLHQLEYILRKIHAPPGRVGIKPTFKLETWRQKGRGGANFLLWEAFVSGKAHAKGKGAHHRDAKTAARAAAAFFFRLGRCPTAYENAQVRVYRFAGLSLAGAALIAARYSFSVRNLASSVVIVKVSKNIARTKPASICVWEEPGFDDVS